MTVNKKNCVSFTYPCAGCQAEDKSSKPNKHGHIEILTVMGVAQVPMPIESEDFLSFVIGYLAGQKICSFAEANVMLRQFLFEARDMPRAVTVFEKSLMKIEEDFTKLLMFGWVKSDKK